MNITREHALSGRSTCRRCTETIPVNAPRAKIRREYDPRKGRTISDTYCKKCAIVHIQVEIRDLQRELHEMEVYR